MFQVPLKMDESNTIGIIIFKPTEISVMNIKTAFCEYKYIKCNIK